MVLHECSEHRQGGNECADQVLDVAQTRSARAHRAEPAIHAEHLAASAEATSPGSVEIRRVDDGEGTADAARGGEHDVRSRTGHVWRMTPVPPRFLPRRTDVL